MSDEEKKFNLSIVADRKPYFQQYIYHSLRTDYLSYIANTNRKALRLFRKDVDEIKAIPPEERTDDEAQFLIDFERNCPVIDGDDVMNSICHKVEKEFASYISNHRRDDVFDPSILKAGVGYQKRQFSEIKKLYEEYTRRVEDYMKYSKKNRIRKADSNAQLLMIKDDFRRMCNEICSNEESLSDVVIDLVYKNEKGRRFAWDICGAQIIRNLLKNNDNMISVPVQDDEGDIEFRGRRYRIERREYIEEEDIMEVLNGTE